MIFDHGNYLNWTGVTLARSRANSSGLCRSGEAHPSYCETAACRARLRAARAAHLLHPATKCCSQGVPLKLTYTANKPTESGRSDGEPAAYLARCGGEEGGKLPLAYLGGG